jgi:hypothetical protein
MEVALFACKNCGVLKPDGEFYRHQAMASGHLSFCKTCVRNRVNEHRSDNLARIQEYDRWRSLEPRRIERNRVNSREKYNALRGDLRTRYPEMYAACTALGNAVRDGRVFRPGRCEQCDSGGCVINGYHHDGPTKPLKVRWLCCPCMGAAIRKRNEEQRFGQRMAAE